MACKRDEPHAVRVAREAPPAFEDEIRRGVEADRVAIEQIQAPALDDGGDASRDPVDVGLFRGLPFQPEHQRLVAAMTAPGRGPANRTDAPGPA